MQDKILEQQIERLKGNYKLTPATLAHELNPSWMATPYLMKIGAIVASAIKKGNARIILSVPPRHGKSELITKHTTIWALEHFPHWNTILATYGAELSTDFGRQVRDIIQDNEHKLTVRIKQDTTKASNWKTPQGGGMAAVGVGGPITGRGANILLVDDYIKEIKEAESQTHRDYLWKWFTTVALTRIEPGGSCIVIATRWHHDDLIGRILKHNEEVGGRWQYIRFPAIADEDNDVLGRQKGQALFPERYNESALAEIKGTLGSFFFNALYQQIPEDDENRITDVDWLQIESQMPDLKKLTFVRVWDLAASENKGDYTAGVLMGHDKDQKLTYILDVKRARLNSAAVESLVRRTAESDGLNVKIYIEQEPGSSGKSLVEFYKRMVLPEFSIEAIPARDGKLVRAQPLLAAIEAGQVRLVKGHWNKAFIDEFRTFPSGEHDDQIDSAAAAYVKLVGEKYIKATWGRSSETPRITMDFINGEYGPAPRAGVVFGRRRH